MSHIAGLLIRPRAGRREQVRRRLEETAGAEIVADDENGFAVVLEAQTASTQRRLHERLAAGSEIEEALLVFQSNRIDDSPTRESTEAEG